MQKESNDQFSKVELQNNRRAGASGRVHYFNITYACNSRCRFCAADLVTDRNGRSKGSIPLRTFITLLDELCVNSKDQVILNGGEPTLHPEFIEFLVAIAQSGASSMVFTNGRKLADVSFAKTMASLHPVELLIPVYSYIAQEHDACTGVDGSFSETMQGIRTVIDLQLQGFRLPIEFRLLLSRTTAPYAAGVVRFISRSFNDGDFCFSLNPLIVSKQAEIGGHAASLFSYVGAIDEVKLECARYNRELITKNLPRCLVSAVSPEQAFSTVFLTKKARSQESYFDPFRLSKDTGENNNADFASSCSYCLLREDCPGFPVGHIDLFGDIDARPLTDADVISKAAEILLPMLGADDRIAVSGSKCVLLPGGSRCIVEPKTGSWFVPGDDGVVDYFASRESTSVAEIELAFAPHGSSLVANLLLSGVGQLNGKSLIPQDSCPSTPHKLNIAALVIKYTRNCNLKCAYCYVRGCHNAESCDLPNKVIIDALDSLAPVLADPCDIIIHGGEPLTRIDDLEVLISCLKDHPIADKTTVSIQTNAILITEAIAIFLRKHDVAIGVSVDGITFDENGYRTFDTGYPSLEDTLEGIKHLLAAGLKPGLLAVLHKRNQHRLLDSLKAYSSFGITDFVVNPLFPGGAAKKLGQLALPETDVALQTLQNMLLWINDENQHRPKGSRLYERNLSTLVQHLTTYKRPYMCSRIPCGAGLHSLSIDADGSLYPCDDFVSSPEFCLGSVFGLKDPDSIFSQHPVVSKLHSRSIQNCEPCCDCTWRAICPSHCAAESYFSAGDLFHGGMLCGVMQLFIPIVIELISSRRIDPQLIIRSLAPGK